MHGVHTCLNESIEMFASSQCLSTHCFACPHILYSYVLTSVSFVSLCFCRLQIIAIFVGLFFLGFDFDFGFSSLVGQLVVSEFGSSSSLIVSVFFGLAFGFALDFLTDEELELQLPSLLSPLSSKVVCQ